MELPNVEIKYQVANLDQVMRYFAKDFELPQGKKLLCVQHYVDASKDAVVFKLTMCDETP